MLAVLLRQLGIDEVPLRLERTTEDRISGLVGRRFQHIEGGLGMQGRDIGGWEVEGRKFGHLVGGGIVNAADKHANKAHGALLSQYRSLMLPRPELVSKQNLTQRLFALPQMMENGGTRQVLASRCRRPFTFSLPRLPTTGYPGSCNANAILTFRTRLPLAA